MAPSGFIADGASRILPILEAQIRSQVEHEFALRLAAASSILQRFRLRLEMRRETTRRLNEQVSPQSLF